MEEEVGFEDFIGGILLLANFPIPGLTIWKIKNVSNQVLLDVDGQPMCRDVYVFASSIRC